MLLLSSMEHRLETAKAEKSDVEDPSDLDLVMKQRIIMAKLEDTYYDDNYDEDEESDGAIIDRRRRFRRAYEVALATDTQGYQVAKAAGGATNTTTADRSAQELTAIGWAAFCTELLPEEDATVRIQALDCGSLFERLKLAVNLLRRKKALLRARMEKAGLKFGGEEFDEMDEGTSDNGGR